MSATTWVRVPLANATIGPESWQNATIRNIKSSHKIVRKSDQSLGLGRLLDELPLLRDEVAQMSNEKCHMYTRQTRKVALVLRKSITSTNEAIKKLIRVKEKLDVELENTRKDILNNNSNVMIRSLRPKREKIHDGADDLLKNEKIVLKSIKGNLEELLGSARIQLQANTKARNRLGENAQERGRVLDLVSKALSFMKTQPGRRPYTSPDVYRYPNRISKDDVSIDEMNPDPLGPLTPEVAESLNEAKLARQNTTTLIKNIHAGIEKARTETSMIRHSVNNALNRKLAETVALKQNLQVAKGNTRMAIHRSQRHKEMTEKALGYVLGPVSYEDVSTRERLDRPIVRTYQRHPGKELPEAKHLIEASANLDEAIKASGQNLAYLHLSKLRLKEDIRDKNVASQIDSAIVRLRRRRGDYRWVMEGVNHERRQPKTR